MKKCKVVFCIILTLILLLQTPMSLLLGTAYGMEVPVGYDADNEIETSKTEETDKIDEQDEDQDWEEDLVSNDVQPLSQNDAVAVSTFSELKAQLDAGTAEIKLDNDIINTNSSLTVKNSVIIYGQGNSIDLGQERINLESGGKIIVYDTKINSSNSGNVLNGFFCVNSGEWEIELWSLAILGRKKNFNNSCCSQSKLLWTYKYKCNGCAWC